MSLVDQGTIKEHLGLPTDIAEELLLGRSSAERRMRRELTLSGDRYYTGGTLYDDIKARAKTDAARKAMQEAETLFCVAYALPRTNLSVEEDGSVSRQKGVQGDRMVSEEWRIQRRIDWLTGQAEDLVRDILSEEDEPDPEGEPTWAI